MKWNGLEPLNSDSSLANRIATTTPAASIHKSSIYAQIHAPATVIGLRQAATVLAGSCSLPRTLWISAVTSIQVLSLSLTAVLASVIK